MGGYLVYHPKRTKSVFDNITIYHAPNGVHQDPYVWNSQFLHTYCHMTQMKPEEEDTIFWVTGDKFPGFSHLFCDLVFVIQEKVYWEKANFISESSEIIDSHEAYIAHYQWAGREHYFQRRRRYTLKADPKRSFQPQNCDGSLIDIVPFLATKNLSRNEVQRGFKANIGSKPMALNAEIVSGLYRWLSCEASIKLIGTDLERIRKQHSKLSSPVIKQKRSKGKCC